METDIPHHTPTSSMSFPCRKPIRAEFHDYSGGKYFITICTHDKTQYFGKIVDGTMVYSKIGQYVIDSIQSLPQHYEYAEIPLFVVMPNHVHLILFINQMADAPRCVPTFRSALSVVVGGFKQSVTMFARRNNITFSWQSRYHDHIIRNTDDIKKISDYIKNNVTRWELDCFHPRNQK